MSARPLKPIAPREVDLPCRSRPGRTDDEWMREALRLAARGVGGTRPNPPVGAVVVTEGRLSGRGFHRKAGGPHAEVEALRAAGAHARGGTLYVTLEPCSTQGRTPPCTEQIIAAGVRQVVVGVRDPNPAHGGRGIRRLQRRGIRTTVGVCADEAEKLIAPFAKWIRTGRPYLTLKMGMTLDGRIADRQRVSKWITGPAARAAVQNLRRTADAILIGSGTARADNPSLLCRTPDRHTRYRVIVDSRGQTPLSSTVLNDKAAAYTILATTAHCAAARRAAYARQGAQVWTLPTKANRVSVRSLMRRLGQQGFLHILCEGGGRLASILVDAGLVDEFVFFVAPRFLGHRGVPVLGGGDWRLSSGPRLVFTAVQTIGDDILITARPEPTKPRD